jgi:hypothetical protein
MASATGWHRVPGVDRQIHDDLLDLTGVGLDHAGLLRLQNAQLDVLAEQPGEQRLQPDDDFAEIDDLGFQHLLAAEGQQLAGQVPGPPVRV